LVQEDMVLETVKEIRAMMPRIGVRKMQHMLFKNYGLDIGRDRLFDILRAAGMLAKPRRNRTRTTFSKHHFHVYPNAIRDVIPTHPNEIWVSDITYILMGDKFHFLYLITDAYSKKIVGRKLADNLFTVNAVAALRMAIKQCESTRGLIHHSDRGTQYCASKYISLLKKHGIMPSMTENGDPRENAIAERVNGILKKEFIELMDLTEDNAEAKLKEIINTYNSMRPHLSLGYFTPDEAHHMNGEQIRLWKPYYYKSRDMSEKNDTFADANNMDDDHLDRYPP
jgi:transposase InsO family protein